MMLRHLPNAITFARLILIVPFLFYLFHSNYQVAFYLFAAAGLSDGVDGFLARRFGWTSELGAFFDPLADKLLLVSSFLALAYLGKLPLWLLFIVVGRDLTIVTGVIAAFHVLGKVDFDPSIESKINTAFQIGLIFLLLFELAFAILPALLIQGLMILVAITTLISLISYVWVWGRKAYLRNK